MSNEKSFPVKGLLLGLGVMAVFATWFLLPLDQWMQAFNEWVKGLGTLGYVAFGALYIVATIALVPGSVLTLAAGLTFGLWAFPVVVCGATIGAWAAFIIARYLARDLIQNRFGDDERFQAIDAVIGENGWKVVGLLRLSPLIPFNLQNYFYGLTDIKTRHYLLATFFGIMPGGLLYVYFGAAGKAALDGSTSGGNPVLKWALFGAGLVATAVVTVFVTKKAKSKLDAVGVPDDLDNESS